MVLFIFQVALIVVEPIFFFSLFHWKLSRQQQPHNPHRGRTITPHRYLYEHDIYWWMAIARINLMVLLASLSCMSMGYNLDRATATILEAYLIQFYTIFFLSQLFSQTTLEWEVNTLKMLKKIKALRMQMKIRQNIRYVTLRISLHLQFNSILSFFFFI